jgi:long-chain fatty acid transport protein
MITSTVWIALAAACASTVPAFAGGLGIYEIGAPDQMFATAGRQALARDASTAYTNPAGMTRLEQSEVLVAIQPVYGDVRFDPGPETTTTGGDGGNAVGFVPTLGSFYVHSFTERIKAGLALNAYVGGGLEYDNKWAGRYFAQDSILQGLVGTLSGAYRVNDWLSLGVGFATVYTKIKLTTALPNLEPGVDARITAEDDHFGFGGTASVLFEPSPTTRIGLIYRSKIDVEMDDAVDLEDVGPLLQGVLEAQGLVGSKVDLDLTFPQFVHAGFYHELGDRFSVMLGLGWEDWSEFSDLGISLDSETDTSLTVDQNIRDTWHTSLGFEYRPMERWRLGVGVGYDSSGVNDKDRTVVLPISRQWRFGTGFEHDLNEAWTVGFQYTLVELGNAPVEQSSRFGGTLKGSYDRNEIHAFNFSVRKKF